MGVLWALLSWFQWMRRVWECLGLSWWVSSKGCLGTECYWSSGWVQVGGG